MRRLCCLVAVLLFAGAAWADEALWERLRQGGHVLLIRHAQTTSGFGDPPGFRLEECATQRNLSEAGRRQARQLGELFRARRITVSEVRSSRWCRCQETAQLAFGQAEPWAVIDSMYADRSQEVAQRRAIAALAEAVRPPHNVALVTHGANILALLGVHPAMGEVVVVRANGDRLEVIGRIPPPA